MVFIVKNTFNKIQNANDDLYKTTESISVNIVTVLLFKATLAWLIFFLEHFFPRFFDIAFDETFRFLLEDIIMHS